MNRSLLFSDNNLNELHVLTQIQTLEWFSFYGIRALLVFYIVNYLELSDGYIFGVYAAFSAFVELGSVVGSWIFEL